MYQLVGNFVPRFCLVSRLVVLLFSLILTVDGNAFVNPDF